jgi:lipoate-protein ligase B
MCSFFGRVGYKRGLEIQELLHDLRCKELIGDTIIFLEHEHVYTVGKGELRGSLDSIFGVPVVKVDRGGKIFYHGPGQLVGYFFFKITKEQISEFVKKIELSILDVLKECGIEGYLDRENPGVWVNNNKIAAIGMTLYKGVTKHGIAINVDPDLAFFGKIDTCGIKNRGVTSIYKEINTRLSLFELSKNLSFKLKKYFERDPLWVDRELLLNLTTSHR